MLSILMRQRSNQAHVRLWPKADIHCHFNFVHLTMYDAPEHLEDQ